MLERSAKSPLSVLPLCLCVSVVYFLLDFFSLCLAAPPQVTFLYPSGGQVGQTVPVTTGGSFSNWPLQAWSDRAELTVECDKEKGKLLVKIGQEAQPGVSWLRLYDGEGASAVRPFLIGTLPEVVEQEPNDDFRQPQQLSGTTIIANGQLGRQGDVDVFALSLAKDQTLVAAMEANGVLGSPMDAALQVLTADGFVRAQSHDERGLDPLLVFTAPAAGTYLVRTFAFPATPNSTINFAGDSTFVYRLTLTTEAFVDAALPMALVASQTNRVTVLGWNLPEELKSLEVTPAAGASRHVLSHPRLAGTLALPITTSHVAVAAADISPIELPAVLSGQLSRPRQQHEFSFRAEKGQRLVFQSESRTLGFAIDPVLTVTDADGKMLGQNDDASRDNREAELTFNVPADGEYRLAIRDLHRQGGPRYIYRVTAGEQQPDFAVKLTADAFTIAAGKSLEITVNVERLAGFKEDLEVTAMNLPEGVTADSVQCKEKDKSVKLKLTAAAESSGSGPIRIIGRTQSESPVMRTASAALTGLGAAIEDVWLTVTKK
jgi:hypothetical protein